MEVVIAILGIVVVVVLAVWLRMMIDRRRDAAIALAAEELGLTYRKDGRDLQTHPFTRFGLFQQGRRRRLRNVIQGHVDEVEMIVFDYRFFTGSHRNHSLWRQTVAAFRLPDMDVPEFDLQPEKWVHKLTELFGYQDIDFVDSPHFSDQYLLRGSDEEAVRDLFSVDLRQFMESINGFSLAGGEHWLVIYQCDRRVGPMELKVFIEETFKIGVKFWGR